ncbi:MAG: Holliday junction branch migration protein RuvA [Patescibacteria group bacterium]
MIGMLEGSIWHTTDRAVTLGVGGVGYIIYVTEDTLFELSTWGERPIRLFTHLAVREDALELFGFRAEKELQLFQMMISISGIGPRKALAILSLAPTATLTKAIANGDTGYLTKVSGVGRKNAEKIVIELREKMTGFFDGSGGDLQEEADVIAAIQALGYSASEARNALKDIPVDIVGAGNRVKAALRSIGKQ